MEIFTKRLLNYWRVNLHRTSFFKDLQSQPKEEEKKRMTFDSFKLNQKQQLHYLGPGLSFVHHETAEVSSKDSHKPVSTKPGHIINFSQPSQNWGFPYKNGLETQEWCVSKLRIKVIITINDNFLLPLKHLFLLVFNTFIKG